jgi:hypothetical protein
METKKAGTPGVVIVVNCSAENQNVVITTSDGTYPMVSIPYLMSPAAGLQTQTTSIYRLQLQQGETLNQVTWNNIVWKPNTVPTGGPNPAAYSSTDTKGANTIIILMDSGMGDPKP